MFAATRYGLLTFLLLAIMTALPGCGGGGGGGGVAGGVSLKAIEVSPLTQNLAIGTSQQFTATGVYSDNSRQDITASVSWSSSDTATASISAGGTATALAAGSTVITAAAGGKSATAALTVTAATISSLSLTPVTQSIAAGTTCQFTAIGIFSDNTTQDLTASASWNSTVPAVAAVSNSGLATGGSAGTTTISADFGGKSGTATLTVTAATITSLSVTPVAPSISAGRNCQFTATGIFSDNSRQDLTASATWSSSSAAVATVSSSGLATGTAVGSATVTATYAGVSASTTLTVSSATLVALDISPVNPAIPLGSRQHLTASGRYSDNSVRDLTADVAWFSSDTAVATVSNTAGQNGLVTPVAVGSSTISARLGSVSASTTITVSPATLSSVAVIPGAASIASGTCQQFYATGTYSDGSTQDVTAQATWTSADAAVAAVSNVPASKGLTSALAAGTTLVTATFGGMSGNAALTVTPATLVTIELTPTDPSIPKGLAQQFNATGVYTDGSTQDLTAAATWTSSDTAVAAVSNAPASIGRASGLAAGTAVITASVGSVSGSTALTVTAATLVSIDVTPAAPTIAKGTVQQFTAVGTYSDSSTQELSSVAAWSSSNRAVALVSNADGFHGLATSLAAGTTTITAAVGNISGGTVLTVSPANLVSIAVTPAVQTLAKGLSQQYTAVGTFDDASTQDLSSQVVWRSSNISVASISNLTASKGTATAVAVGTTNITATLMGVTSAGATLTVSAATLQVIDITPVAPSIALKTNQQFTAMGTYSDTSVRDITKFVTWNSSSTAVATISNSGNTRGLATPVAAGQTTIRAALGGVSRTTTLTVSSATLVSIAVTPANQTIAKGATLQFTATGTFSNSSTQDVTRLVTWASSNKSAANISNSRNNKGVSKGLGNGTTTISASLLGVAGTTTLTVH